MYDEERMPADMDLRILLERVAGEINLISERQLTAKEYMQRLETMHLDGMRTVHERLNTHSNRLGNLENDRRVMKGVVAVWTAISGIVLAVVGIFAKVMGWA